MAANSLLFFHPAHTIPVHLLSDGCPTRTAKRVRNSITRTRVLTDKGTRWSRWRPWRGQSTRTAWILMGRLLLLHWLQRWRLLFRFLFISTLRRFSEFWFIRIGTKQKEVKLFRFQRGDKPRFFRFLFLFRCRKRRRRGSRLWGNLYTSSSICNWRGRTREDYAVVVLHN